MFKENSFHHHYYQKADKRELLDLLQEVQQRASLSVEEYIEAPSTKDREEKKEGPTHLSNPQMRRFYIKIHNLVVEPVDLEDSRITVETIEHLLAGKMANVPSERKNGFQPKGKAKELKRMNLLNKNFTSAITSILKSFKNFMNKYGPENGALYEQLTAAFPLKRQSKVHANYSVPIIKNPELIVLLRQMLNQGLLQVYDYTQVDESDNEIGKVEMRAAQDCNYILRKGEDKSSPKKKTEWYITVLVQIYYHAREAAYPPAQTAAAL